MSNKNTFYWMFLFVLGLSACNREVYIPPYHTPTLPPAKLSIIRDSTVEKDSLRSEPAAVVTEMFDTSVYTEQNPATDPSDINALLEVAKQRYLSGITKPGWYASTNVNDSGQVWVYIDDPVTFKIKEIFDTSSVSNYQNQMGEIIILGMMLPDGKDGFFTINKERNDTVIDELNTYPRDGVYTLNGDLPDYFFMIESHFVNVTISLSYINPSKEPNPFPMQTSRKAWLSGDGDHRLLEVQTHSVGLAGKKSTESDARQTESTITERFNWYNGSFYSWHAIQYYTDGSTVENMCEGQELASYTYQYYETLPPEVQALYDDAARKLIAAYAAKGIN